jgi:nitrogen regulatory protein PII
MKRVDLILSERELDPVLQAIDQAGCSGYTVMRHVTGRGPRGAFPTTWNSAVLGRTPT